MRQGVALKRLPKKRKLTAMRCFKPNRSDRLQKLYDDAQAKLLKASVDLRAKNSELEALKLAYQDAYLGQAKSWVEVDRQDAMIAVLCRAMENWQDEALAQSWSREYYLRECISAEQALAQYVASYQSHRQRIIDEDRTIAQMERA